MLKKIITISIFYVFILFGNKLDAQTTIRVPADYPSIQQALNAAKENTTILVSPGIYYENIIWPGTIDGIKLIGTEGSSKTIIDGNKTGRVVKIEGESSFNEDPTITRKTQLKGFTIRNGAITSGNGAGLLCYSATPTFYDLVVTQNVCGGSTCSGAGAYLDEYSGTLENCVFSENRNQASSRTYGGGLNIGFTKSLTIRDCTFDKNAGVSQSWCYGGGLFIEPSFNSFDQIFTSVNIVNCKFLYNTTQTGSWSFGAGLYISDFLGSDSVKYTIDSCQFVGNHTNNATWSHGAGLFTDVIQMSVSNSQFVNNYAEYGAGIYYDAIIAPNYELKVKNSTFNNNTILGGNSLGGSAIFAGYDRVSMSLENVVMSGNSASPVYISDEQSTIDLRHCTIYDNEKKCTFGNATVNAMNTIVWNKPDKEYTTSNSNHKYTHSIIKGGYMGVGNMNTDPLLVNQDLPIPAPQSPCLNAGIRIPGIETDILGYPRVMPANSLPDIGAYEMDQYFAHALVKFYYDVNQNKVKDGDEKYLGFGSIHDQNGREYVNVSENGRYIILPQGKNTLTYHASSNPRWKNTGNDVFELDVNAATFSQVVEIGLYPDELQTQVETNVIGDNFRCGEEVKFALTATNYGTTIESGLFWLKIDERIDSIRFLKDPDETYSDHHFAWQYNDLYPGESVFIEFYATAPLINTPEQLGELYTFCHGLPDIAPRGENCYDAELRCSFDPNDKFSIPQREDFLSLIDRPLNYTIRFQNTGNDYARNVVIRDTIDPSFELHTFKLIQTSHPEAINVFINPDREIVFEFKNIFLPDSTTNQEASNGHILYSIEYMDGITPNTEVNNTANIFFDFNPAIVTNTTKNIVVTAFPVSAENISKQLVSIYPNPTNDELHFNREAEEVWLYNWNGQLIQQANQTKTLRFNVAPGTYFVKLKVNGSVSAHKVIVTER